MSTSPALDRVHVQVHKPVHEPLPTPNRLEAYLCDDRTCFPICRRHVPLRQTTTTPYRLCADQEEEVAKAARAQRPARGSSPGSEGA